MISKILQKNSSLSRNEEAIEIYNYTTICGGCIYVLHYFYRMCTFVSDSLTSNDENKCKRNWQT